ncbi:MAG: DUF11 domain-containing protein [Chloroflexi bacterium]|nr:DUF11 domain-containing protein [Chloroflexota bacterium]
MTRKVITPLAQIVLVVGIVFGLIQVLQAANIDPTDKWAWGTNIGWINFGPTHGGGVTVYDDHLEGYVWAENVGWIRLGTYTGGGSHDYLNTNSTNYGVNHDGAGNLEGYAWGTNIGWINFNPAHNQVTIDLGSGSFDGYAWAENVGWIHFKNVAPAYNVVVNFSSSPSLGINKTVMPGSTIPGQPITYTLTFSNTSATIASGIVITDIIPISVTNTSVISSGVAITQTNVGVLAYTWRVQDMALNDTGIITISGVLSSSLPPGSSFINTAIITTTSGEVDTTNNVATATLTVSGADLRVGKSVTPILPLEGDTITYTIVVTNIAGNPSSNVVISDVLPTGIMYGGLVSGSPSQGNYTSGSIGVWSGITVTLNSTASLVFTATVNGGTGGNTLINTTGISNTSTWDPDTSNNYDSASVTVAVLEADLRIGKSVTPVWPMEGDTITYTIVVTNIAGNSSSTVVISDVLPTGITYGGLVPGSPSQGSYTAGSTGVWSGITVTLHSTASLVFTATVDGGTEGSILVNTAGISNTGTGDPNISNNYDSASVTVVGDGTLDIAKSFEDLSGAPLKVGDELLYTIVVTNLLNSVHPGVVITDAIPVNTTYVPGSANVSQGSVSGPDPLVADVGTMAGSGSATLAFRVSVDSSALGQVITNSAQADSPVQEPPLEVGPIQAPETGVVQPFGNPPTISNIPNQTTAMNVPITVYFGIGDTETPADALTLTVESSNPLLAPLANISLGGSGENRSITITPTTAITGSSDITITVDDGAYTASESFTLYVGVSAPPDAVNDIRIVPEGIASTIAVMDNDYDPDGDAITVTMVGAAAHGTLSTNGSTVTYTPTQGFIGSDSFTYTISDGVFFDTALVSVEVWPVTDLAVNQNIKEDISYSIFTLVARNLGDRPAGGAIISDTFPAGITGITWTCASANATCTASGSGNVFSDTLTSFPSGGVVTYTVFGTVPAGRVLSNTVALMPPPGVFDLDMGNNIATKFTRYRIILPLTFKNYGG